MPPAKEESIPFKLSVASRNTEFGVPELLGPITHVPSDDVVDSYTT